MGVNKVTFGAVPIIDITDSTVTPENLLSGATAYDASGEKVTGTARVAASDDGNGNVVVTICAIATDNGSGDVDIS